MKKVPRRSNHFQGSRVEFIGKNGFSAQIFGEWIDEKSRQQSVKTRLSVDRKSSAQFELSGRNHTTSRRPETCLLPTRLEKSTDATWYPMIFIRIHETTLVAKGFRTGRSSCLRSSGWDVTLTTTSSKTSAKIIAHCVVCSWWESGMTRTSQHEGFATHSHG